MMTRKRTIWIICRALCLLYIFTHCWAWHPRFWQLQFLGRVPDGSSYPFHRDWRMAEQTWWWGKRIDPREFWQDRPVWHDDKATIDAWRRGRSYPPIPYDNPAFADRSDRDEQPSIFAIDGIEGGPVIRFVHSPREAAFWDKFTKTHPLPPAYIEREQRSYGRNMVHEEYILANDPVYAARLRLKPNAPQETVESARYHLRAFGFPNEALTSNALFWAYVLEQRSEYQKMMSSWSHHPSVISKHIARLQVDPRLITEPLTDEQITQANAWKVEYLKRLKRDGIDDSYINAYLKAWKLDLAQINRGK